MSCKTFEERKSPCPKQPGQRPQHTDNAADCKLLSDLQISRRLAVHQRRRRANERCCGYRGACISYSNRGIESESKERNHAWSSHSRQFTKSFIDVAPGRTVGESM